MAPVLLGLGAYNSKLCANSGFKSNAENLVLRAKIGTILKKLSSF